MGTVIILAAASVVTVALLGLVVFGVGEFIASRLGIWS
jgi:hypothetical protein